MQWMNGLRRKFSRFAIPNLMLYITTGMLFVFIVEMFWQFPLTAYIDFSRTLIFQGQIWRLVTFLFIPTSSSLLWLLISLMVMYSIGSNLESKWGSSTFTFYYILGAVGAIIAGLITGYTTNIFINTSMIMAFGLLFPNAQFTIYLLIPVKAFYIAVAEIIIYAGLLVLYLVRGNFSMALSLIASLIGFIIFFGPTIFDEIRRYFASRKRRKEFEKQVRGNWKD